MCKPVSIQSPSLSCHALTLPPSTLPLSRTIGTCPASATYLAQLKPARPPPTIITFLGVVTVVLFRESDLDNALASW